MGGGGAGTILTVLDDERYGRVLQGQVAVELVGGRRGPPVVEVVEADPGLTHLPGGTPRVGVWG